MLSRALLRIATYSSLMIAAISFLGGCVSQTSATKNFVDLQPVEKPFLWKVKKGGQQSWLFGTIHLGIDAERELPKEVWDAFNASDCFVMEANPADISLSEVAKYAYLPEGQRLSKLVKPEIYDRLQKKLNGTIPDSLLDKSQPWFVSILLLRTGHSQNISMDAAMLARAKQSGKQIYFLEDWRDAIKDLAAVTSAEDLTEMLKNEGQLEKELAELIETYRSGEEEKIAEILERLYGNTPANKAKMHRLIDGRNVKWMQPLTSAIERGSCFVAVGAGHYLGDKSLKALLSDSGWVVL
jgi:uncharacterized protein YbaP (TraB family)